MKLLSTFQLAILFAKATMHAQIFCVRCAMTWIRPMVNHDAIWKKNKKKR